MAPRSAFCLAQSRPPCSSTIDLAIASPIPRPSGLVVDKRLEQVRHEVLFDASTRVAHGKIEEPRFSEESAHFDSARTFSDGANRIERVQDQVEDELLNQDAISCNPWERGCNMENQ